MNRQQPSRLPKLSEVVSAARNGVVSRLPSRRALIEATVGEGGGKLPALVWQGFDAVSDALNAAGARGGMLGRSFVATVILPTIVFWLYAAFWESNRYVAETRITVREAQEKKQSSAADASSIISKMTGGGSKNSSQDPYIVLNYVKSRAILVDLGGRDYLERKFSGSGIDYFSRLPRDSNLEDLLKYWLGHVFASVDTMSNILTVRVDAFQPQDALAIAKDIIRMSEDLINKITLRNRGDAVSRAELEVNLSRQMLADAREKVLQFRNQNFLIDPSSRAASLGEMIGKLTLERIDIVNALSTFSSSLSSDAPSQRLQRTRLAAIDQQIADLKKKLTDSQGAGTVSAQIATYERLKLEEQFAEKLYTISQSSFEKARQELQKQQLYVVTIVAPTLPESATFPKVWADTLLLFAALLVTWAIISLLVASVVDHIV